jgi:hypothetical protein
MKLDIGGINLPSKRAVMPDSLSSTSSTSSTSSPLSSLSSLSSSKRNRRDTTTTLATESDANFQISGLAGLKAGQSIPKNTNFETSGGDITTAYDPNGYSRSSKTVSGIDDISIEGKSIRDAKLSGSGASASDINANANNMKAVKLCEETDDSFAKCEAFDELFPAVDGGLAAGESAPQGPIGGRHIYIHVLNCLCNYNVNGSPYEYIYAYVCIYRYELL